MYTFINKKYLLAILPFICLSYSINLATLVITDDNKVKDNFSWKNSRIDINTAFNIIPTDSPKQSFEIGTIKKDKPKSISQRYGFLEGLQVNLEALAVYDFTNLLSATNFKFDLELGVIYSLPKMIEIEAFNILFTEYYLKFPLNLVISRSLSSYFRYSFLVGYEIEYILSSQYNQSGYYSDLPVTMRGNKNIKKLLPNAPKFWNSIIAGMRFEFPKGIHLDINLHITPSLYRKSILADNYDELDDKFVTLLRGCKRSFLDLKIGVNIMEWFFPKE